MDQKRTLVLFYQGFTKLSTGTMLTDSLIAGIIEPVILAENSGLNT
jgi:hypothetical protein